LALAVIEKQPVTASINSQQNRQNSQRSGRNSQHAGRNSQPGRDNVFDAVKEHGRAWCAVMELLRHYLTGLNQRRA